MTGVSLLITTTILPWPLKETTASLNTKTRSRLGGAKSWRNFADTLLRRYLECNNKGDDRGVTLSYEYNLAVASEGYSGDYEDQVTSWRC